MKGFISVGLVMIVIICLVLSGCDGNNDKLESNTNESKAITNSSIYPTEKTSENQLAESIQKPTEKETVKPTEKATEKPSEQQNNNQTTSEAQTLHIHNWENITTTIHHDAVTRDVWVVDEPEKNIYIERKQYWCQYCNCRWSYSSQNNDEADLNRMLDDMDNHLVRCENNWQADPYRMDFNRPIINVISSDDIVTIDEKGHYETEIIKAAYDEEKIIGQKCMGCGEIVMI